MTKLWVNEVSDLFAESDHMFWTMEEYFLNFLYYSLWNGHKFSVCGFFFFLKPFYFILEDEMVGWCHWLDGHEFEQAPGVGDGQGSLACFSPWGCKELDTTEQLNWIFIGSIVDLQCSITFFYTAKWISYMCIHKF